MFEVLTDLIRQLNMVEVHGKTNLALMYNVIDALEQIKTASSETRVEEAPNVEVKTE